MSAPQYDVVIAGAGVSGAILANKLGQAGFRVLILDAGEEALFDPATGADQRQSLLDRYFEADARVPNSPYRNLPWAPMPFVTSLSAYYYGPQYQTQPPLPPPAEPEDPGHGSYTPFKSTYTRIVGGTTYHWLGTMLRYVPSTFRERTTYGRAVDWPITYDVLEPWYLAAEHEIGVSGDGSLDLGGAPRHGKPYPMPQILPSYTDRVMKDRLDGLEFDGMPVLVQSTPQGRNSIPFQGRPPCAGSTNCVPICPIQAKYDATVHLKRALNPSLDPKNRPGSRPVQHQWKAVVTKVDVGGDGRISGLRWKDGENGREYTVTAHAYVLAMHAIETPKVLLWSGSDQNGLADGVANRSGMVGRHLMDHHVKISYGRADVPLYPFRGPLSTSGIESLRDGQFRRNRAAFRVEIEAIGTNWALNTPFGEVASALMRNEIGASLRRDVAWNVSTGVQLDALFEPDPNPNSRVTIARDDQGNVVTDAFGVPRPRLDFVLDDYTLAGAKAFEELSDAIITRMSGGKQTKADLVDGFFGAGHVMGTLRMGDSPSQSVTNDFGRSWDHPNLWLTGSGLFPTVGSANPTLTIVAVTLRQAEALRDELRQRVGGGSV
ncbi:GMC oxidoreductase [Paraliomyxa miuraensis]|uniref:GMC oxidoreductase n=1 Tax=Paraliomyxa miuraensis TaxID=376150 RepID=UPI00224E570A|nr:GMC family oxidoreductase [Paraliomyxa miuraensis]MCX4240386.1 GMC family oxidoreductase [Paraliomyxa miuraensis]